MKLLTVVTSRLTLLTALVLAFWSVFFYFALMDEVTDEVDDSLEDYAELIILRSLAGEPLPTTSAGSNNQFYLRRVSDRYAATHAHVRYADRDVYIKEKGEDEPARVLSYIFRRADGAYMEVEVSTPHIDKADLRAAIFYWLVFLYVAILLGIVAVNVWGVRRSVRPLYVLLRWIDAYRLGRPSRPLANPTRITEFARLNAAVERHTARSEALYTQQKLFTGHASHEMQTPLAVCLGRIEMLLDDEALTEAQMGELLKVKHTLTDLSRLNRSLLLLCRIENGQFARVESLELGGMARRLAADLDAAFAARRPAVEVTVHAPLRVEMDESLATMLLRNLLTNAYVHNTPGGRVRVSVDSRTLRVENTGSPEPLDPDAVFERFVHTPGRAGSTGLGLAIARAIAVHYGFALTYRFEGGLHVFEVRV